MPRKIRKRVPRTTNPEDVRLLEDILLKLVDGIDGLEDAEINLTKFFDLDAIESARSTRELWDERDQL